MSDVPDITVNVITHRRRVWLGGLCLLFLALATRFVGLGSLDLWGDEVYSWIASTDLITQLLRWETIENQAHSPLPFIEMKIARTLLGNSDFSARFFVAVYSTAAIMAVYLLIGTRVGWGAGFWGALLLCVNPFVLEWGREARMYSNWLFYTVLIVALAEAAVVRARRGDWPAALDWRWWLLGIAFMLVHASNVHAVFTLAGAGLALGVVVLVEVTVCRRLRAAAIIAAGSLLAASVYLCSWGLTGLGKLLHYATAPSQMGPAAQPVPMDLLRDIRNVYSMVAGYTPGWWTVVLWGLAIAGLVILLRRRWVLAVMLIAVAQSAWMSWPMLAAKLWFTGRYSFVATLTLSVGLGTLAAWAWSTPVLRRRWVGPALVLGMLTVTAAVWSPVWREIYTVPKMAVRQALAPIVRHATPDEALVLVPDFYYALSPYYDLGSAPLMRPPHEGRYTPSSDNPDGGTGPSRKFTLDFDKLVEQGGAAALPQAVWVFMVVEKSAQESGIDLRLRQLRRLLEAYGVDDPAHLAECRKAADAPRVLTVTMRITRGRIDHITTTRGRRHR